MSPGFIRFIPDSDQNLTHQKKKSVLWADLSDYSEPSSRAAQTNTEPSKVTGKSTIRLGLGSILGPLLFNVFLNDILVIYNYADDNTLSFIHANIEVLKKVLEDESCILIDCFFFKFHESKSLKISGNLYWKKRT